MYRVGFGYDSHRFAEDRPLMLGGVRVACERGLAGHSDADVVLHAITDAVLGAIGEADIGEHFPDTDPRWAGADSGQILAAAASLARERGYDIRNCDVTILAERPNLKAHKARMKARIGELLGIGAPNVAVKAKTNEGMGFVGRGEGIAAMAVVLVAWE